MKRINHIIILCSLMLTFLPAVKICIAQDPKLGDSLEKVYNEKINNVADTERLELLKQLSFNVTDPAHALRYNYELLRLARKLNNNAYLYFAYFLLGSKKTTSGDYPGALQDYITSSSLASTPIALANSYIGMADIYNNLGNYVDAKAYYQHSIELLKPRLNNWEDSVILASVLINKGEAFRKNGETDSAMSYGKDAMNWFQRLNYPLGKAYAIGNIGLVYASLGQIDIAEKNISQAIAVMRENEAYDAICEYLSGMADIELKKGDTSKAIANAKKSVELAENWHLNKQAADGNKILSELYEKYHDPLQGLLYYKSYIMYRDSLNDVFKQRSVDVLQKDFEVSQKQAEIDEANNKRHQQKILLFASLAVLAVIIGLSVLLLRNFGQKKKAYRLLSEEKKVTEEQRDLANNTLAELKRTQAHLIQSEKMASLGQLTAGIAHEIQNPLNFVTNFAELNNDIVAELREENKKGNAGTVDTLLSELLTNSEKINFHGKRADSIVKGMLQHSRGGESEKKPTDINALVDEYFRLAYHGLRAKDKTFNAAMHTDLDPSIGKIDIVPQEIARAVLNLVNNAFYAVSARAREMGESFTPTVTVSTKLDKDHVLVSVKDNGTGIPKEIRDKIFQPFYTTKGPDIGTGLGLYLTYEIVKSHGGEIRVESSEGEGTEFIIVLPDFK